jgi:hypothetical protein
MEKEKAKKMRCVACRKILSLAVQITCACACGQTLCNTHRAPDQHNCTHDFFKADRAILARQLFPSGQEALHKERAARKLEGV